MEMEYRTSLDVKANAEGQGFSGHASHFWSVDSYISAVAPGAFKKTIAERGEKILVMFNHNPERVIGRATDLKEDKAGLFFNARISDTTDGRDLMTLLRDDVPLGVSFSFKTIKSRSGTDDDPFDFGQYKAKASEVEVLTEMKLYELGPVPYPANEFADIAAVRKRAEGDYLSSILNALAAETVDDDVMERAKQIVDAMQARAAAGETTALADAEREAAELAAKARVKQQHRRFDFALATARA